MFDLKKQKAKKCVLKPSVFVYAKMNAAREMTLKNDAKRSFFRKKGGESREKHCIIQLCLQISLRIGLRLTMNFSRRGIWDIYYSS